MCADFRSNLFRFISVEIITDPVCVSFFWKRSRSFIQGGGVKGEGSASKGSTGPMTLPFPDCPTFSFPPSRFHRFMVPLPYFYLHFPTLLRFQSNVCFLTLFHWRVETRVLLCVFDYRIFIYVTWSLCSRPDLLRKTTSSTLYHQESEVGMEQPVLRRQPLL